MIGFTARSSSVRAPLRVDHNELLEAAWFDKRDVRVAAAISVGPTANKQHAAALLANHPHAKLLLPPKGTISRSLIDNWLDDVNGTEAARGYPRESSGTSGYFGPYMSSAERFI
jgi:NADH pyrophosphatase NudC (nudix superfamily)